MWPCLLGTTQEVEQERGEDVGALHRRQMSRATDEVDAPNSRCKTQLSVMNGTSAVRDEER